jgi:lipopolysaccharide O-acetyltransferase
LWLHAISAFNQRQFQPSITIGDRVSFSERVHITCIEKVHIGNGVLIGSGVYIGDHHHGDYSGGRQSHPDTPPILRDLGGGGPVIIGDNVWIGDNAVIIGPVSIGTGAIIGANSVVRREVPAYTMAAGAPARPIKQFNHSTGQWERVWADDSNITQVRLEKELEGEHL